MTIATRLKALEQGRGRADYLPPVCRCDGMPDGDIVGVVLTTGRVIERSQGQSVEHLAVAAQKASTSNWPIAFTYKDKPTDLYFRESSEFYGGFV